MAKKKTAETTIEETPLGNQPETGEMENPDTSDDKPETGVTDNADTPADEPEVEEAENQDKSDEQTDDDDDVPVSQPEAEEANKADTSANEPEVEMNEYTIHGCRISHHGNVYKEGEKINLTAEEAKNLKQFVRE